VYRNGEIDKMGFLRNFIKKLLILDVIFGVRTKKLAGVNDKLNTSSHDIVVDSADNSIDFTNNDIPEYLEEERFFRIEGGGPNDGDLFKIKQIVGNKVFVYENVQDETANRTIDARLWKVHGDNSISREAPNGSTMFNIDNFGNTGNDGDGSQISVAYTSHYHTDYEKRKKHGVEPDGNKDNDNLIYILPNGEKFVDGTLEVYLSHLHLDNDQFVPNGTNTGFTIVLDPDDRWKLNCPPQQGESLTINYLQDVE